MSAAGRLRASRLRIGILYHSGIARKLARLGQEEAVLSVLRRLDKLETSAGIDDEQDIIVFFWGPASPEERKRLRAEVRARIAPGDYKPGGVYWPDGTEVTPP